MNLLVRLVWDLYFQCHFVSEVAGDNRRLPATNDSPATTHCELTLKMAAQEVEEDSLQIIDKKAKKLHGVSQIQD